MSHSPLRLLIVDDEAGTRNMLERAMSRRGFDTRVAETVDEALGLIARERFDCALLDLKIHHDSGLELIAPLRAENPRARIILLTGYSSIPTAVAAIKLGADDYLCKPAGGEQLVAALTGMQSSATADADLPEIASAPPSVNRLAWEHIQRVLAENDGNISATARALGMHRRTLQRKLQKRPKGQ
ncbi:response regulator [Microbulbifer agarilyticus]|uniref:response regulator transcription factor n=1 Tax=Microbulbifer agarilyticus TaxID=260552 RepID=UPI001C9667A8|nr:response regulator [Microbulbifer agarilyticus]MBY6210304.1 response regulator [Microbulbifer agarilyticus]